LIRKYYGNGYATEEAKTMVDYAFKLNFLGGVL
jgi:RimJ/RimL family protein N-acetyltransferase